MQYASSLKMEIVILFPPFFSQYPKVTKYKIYHYSASEKAKNKSRPCRIFIRLGKQKQYNY